MIFLIYGGFIVLILTTWIVGSAFIVLVNQAHRESGVGRPIRWKIGQPGVTWTTAAFFNRYDFKTHRALVITQWGARVVHMLLGLMLLGMLIFVGADVFFG